MSIGLSKFASVCHRLSRGVDIAHGHDDVHLLLAHARTQLFHSPPLCLRCEPLPCLTNALSHHCSLPAPLAAPQIESARWSFAGYVTAIKAFDVNAFPGILYISSAVAWTLQSLFSIWVLKNVIQAYRKRGGATMQEELQMEATKGVVRNMFSRKK